jgi:hypothetical protein
MNWIRLASTSWSGQDSHTRWANLRGSGHLAAIPQDRSVETHRPVALAVSSARDDPAVTFGAGDSQFRCRSRCDDPSHAGNRGTVRARLVQVDLLNGAAEMDLVHFDSTAFPPAHSFVTNAAPSAEDSSVMDFVNFAYYVEATLTAPEITIGNPPRSLLSRSSLRPTSPADRDQLAQSPTMLGAGGWA